MGSRIILKGTKEGVRCVFPEDKDIMELERMCD